MDGNPNQTDRPGTLKGFRSFLSHNFLSAKILFPGLAIAQVIATLHVYLSNSGLYRSLESIASAGYLIVPNHNTMKNLLEFGPAFYGGLFFSLSVGALLSLLGLVSAFMWVRLFKRGKKILPLFMILWVGFIGQVNIEGFCPVITLYFLFIPSIVFITASRYIPAESQNKTSLISGMARITPVLLIVILWTLQINNGVFINIRDNLLLSNPAGTKVNDFYYKYTQYAAEALRSMDQRIINIYRFDKTGANAHADEIRNKLINYDFIETNENTPVKLTISKQNNSLSLNNDEKVILTMSTGDFLSNPEDRLNEFSSRIDRLEFFRHFTYISLLAGFPAVMVIFTYSFLGIVLNLFFNHRLSCTISLYICLTAAVLLSVFFNHVSKKDIETKDLHKALRSVNWQDKVTALKKIDEEKLDISRFADYREMLSSPYIPVRYWLAKVLGVSHDPYSYRALQILMDDPSPNVVCMAYYSTGQKENKRSIAELLKRIKLSGHWHEQSYAYKSLRALGWKQTTLK